MKTIVKATKAKNSIKEEVMKRPDDYDAVSAAVKIHGMALRKASQRLKEDVDIVTTAVQENGMALQYANEDLRKDFNIVKAAAQENIFALKYAKTSLSNTFYAAMSADKTPLLKMLIFPSLTTVISNYALGGATGIVNMTSWGISSMAALSAAYITANPNSIRDSENYKYDQFYKQVPLTLGASLATSLSSTLVGQLFNQFNQLPLGGKSALTASLVHTFSTSVSHFRLSNFGPTLAEGVEIKNEGNEEDVFGTSKEENHDNVKNAFTTEETTTSEQTLSSQDECNATFQLKNAVESLMTFKTFMAGVMLRGLITRDMIIGGAGGLGLSYMIYEQWMENTWEYPSITQAPNYLKNLDKPTIWSAVTIAAATTGAGAAIGGVSGLIQRKLMMATALPMSAACLVSYQFSSLKLSCLSELQYISPVVQRVYAAKEFVKSKVDDVCTAVTFATDKVSAAVTFVTDKVSAAGTFTKSVAEKIPGVKNVINHLEKRMTELTEKCPINYLEERITELTKNCPEKGVEITKLKKKIDELNAGIGELKAEINKLTQEECSEKNADVTNKTEKSDQREEQGNPAGDVERTPLMGQSNKPDEQPEEEEDDF